MPSALELRNSIASLSRLATRDFNAAWGHYQNFDQAGVALNDLLPPLVNTYGPAAATLSADWYDELRDERGVRGTFRAIPADIPDSGTQSLVGWAKSEATGFDAFQTLILGGMQRRIANFARQTITVSSVADPGARGWERVGAGECEFCAMLIGRGAVYSEASADFASHDHCNCAAVPAFG